MPVIFLAVENLASCVPLKANFPPLTFMPANVNTLVNRPQSTLPPKLTNFLP